jgi:predicted histone-like DNA-binding protein
MYKAVPKGQPGVVGGGQIKYYASIIRDRDVNIRKFADEISERSMIGTTEVFGVLESFIQLMIYHMADGRMVKLGDLGTFSPTIHSHGEDVPEKVDRVTIDKYRVKFKPSAYLEKRLSIVDFEKISNGTSAATE